MLWIPVVIIAVLLIWSVGAYNGLVRLRQRVKNAWSQIDVQLKRRYDLIPNLVETCKGYMKHEREVLENVTRARTQAIEVKGGAAEQAKAENFLTQTLRSLFAVAENYPQLKANENLLQLQEELTSTENRIAFARQYYNDQAMKLNTRTEVFPTNLISQSFGFKKVEFFEVEIPEERQPVKVSF
ncbi:MAG: LemA family protein [Candidatus Euphemobacter frigidus]|nr:LemA family protein [Candidatus Euphemobacter frigidus]MDP8275696.1 LemA family protein [Candidatus Euphemobacter frigidus]